MVIVDQTGRMLLVNSQTESMFGYRREELLNQPVEILIPENFRRKHLQHREAYHEAPHPRAMGSGLELLGRRKDGSTFPVEISLSPLEEEGGVLVTAAIRDVTERKQAEEALRQSQERFRLLVEEVKDYAIFMLDPTGRIVSWNEGAQKIKGYTAEEIIGQHFSCFYVSEDVDRGKPNEELTLAASEGRWEEEGWRLRKDGSRFWADVVITALHDKDGNLLGFTKVTRDITEGKRAREAFLLEITNALVSNLDVRQLLSAIASCVRQVKPFDYATLALYDAHSQDFAHACARSFGGCRVGRWGRGRTFGVSRQFTRGLGVHDQETAVTQRTAWRKMAFRNAAPICPSVVKVWLLDSTDRPGGCDWDTELVQPAPGKFQR